MQNFRAWYIQLPAKTRQIVVILLALAVLVTIIAVFQGGQPVKREVYDKKADQITNVLTDTSNRNVGLDNMAGQIRRLNEQHAKLMKEVDQLREAQAMDRASNQQNALASQIASLTSQIETLQSERRDGGEVEAQTSTPDMALKSRREKVHQGGVSNSTPDVPKTAQTVTTVQSNPFTAQPVTEATVPAKGAPHPKAIRIHVVGDDDEAEDAPKEVKAPQDAVAYIPAGSILTGTIITGADFPTSKGAMENPTPTLIRLQKEAILPNRYRSDVRECFLLVGGRGELSSERAKLRGEMLSCVRNDGAVIETKLNSYVAGEDGKEGVKGRLVSKQGQMIARSLVAGFASGMSDAFDYDPVPVIATDTSNNTQYQRNFSSDAMKGGFAKGASTALERVADFYMDLAEEMFPVVEINAGRQVDVVVISGTRLRITAESVDGKSRE